MDSSHLPLTSKSVEIKIKASKGKERLKLASNEKLDSDVQDLVSEPLLVESNVDMCCNGSEDSCQSKDKQFQKIEENYDQLDSDVKDSSVSEPLLEAKLDMCCNGTEDSCQTKDKDSDVQDSLLQAKVDTRCNGIVDSKSEVRSNNFFYLETHTYRFCHWHH